MLNYAHWHFFLIEVPSFLQKFFFIKALETRKPSHEKHMKELCFAHREKEKWLNGEETIPLLIHVK